MKWRPNSTRKLYILVRENLLLENFEQRCGVILLLPAVLKIDCEEE